MERDHYGPRFSPYEELERALRDAQASRDEALRAVSEIARLRASTMLGGYKMEGKRFYEPQWNATRHVFRLEPIAWAYQTTHHPLDVSPAIVVEHTLEELKRSILPQFAGHVYRMFAQTQGRA